MKLREMYFRIPYAMHWPSWSDYYVPTATEYADAWFNINNHPVAETWRRILAEFGLSPDWMGPDGFGLWVTDTDPKCFAISDRLRDFGFRVAQAGVTDEP